jgi:hypothetical protein
MLWPTYSARCLGRVSAYPPRERWVLMLQPTVRAAFARGSAYPPRERYVFDAPAYSALRMASRLCIPTSSEVGL